MNNTDDHAVDEEFEKRKYAFCPMSLLADVHTTDSAPDMPTLLP